MRMTTTMYEPVAVATYASAEGAERAVAHLVGLGYDERELGIAPRAFEAVDQHPLRRRLRRWSLLGLTAATTGMTIVALARELTWRAWVDSVLPLVAWGALGGTVAGVVVALVAHRRERRRQVVPSPDVVAPTRFEVVVGRDPDRARHGLARWWDPAAPPARWQQPA